MRAGNYPGWAEPARPAAAVSIRNDRIAAALWVAFTVVVLAATKRTPPTIENVFEVYREAGVRWQAGADLYPAEFRFNYLPQSAAFFVPWSWLPFATASRVWQVLNIAIFAFGVRSLAWGPRQGAIVSRFLPATVTALLLGGSAARYGQATLAMAGLMMLATNDVERGAFTRAATLCAAAVALKPLAVVLLLVLAAVYPGLRWRTAIAIAVLMLLPFLSQSPEYVLRQYAAVPAMLQARAEQAYLWQNVFGLASKLGWVASAAQQITVRAAGALAVLFLSWHVSRKRPETGVAIALYALAACYVLLFGSATERNTYAMMGPVLGLLAAVAWDYRHKALLGSMLALTTVMVLSHSLQQRFPDTVLSTVKPMAGCALLAWLAWIVTRGLRPVPSPDTAADRR